MLLEVRNLCKYFPIRKHMSRRKIGTVKAVDGVTFQVRRGETVGLVGESGSGKTTVARCILRAIKPTCGQVIIHDQEKRVDVLSLQRQELRRFRRHMQLIFQDPYSSLNPRMTVSEIVSEPLLIHGIARGVELEHRARSLIRLVGLDEKHLNRYPHAFSGGQRQRIGIARALALQPSLIIADEPVSALDMSMQAQILNLLKDLQRKLDLTYVFIAHDLSVIRHFCDRVLVMYAGNLVETADSRDLFAQPMHPYTKALLSAAPRSDPAVTSNQTVLKGEVSDPANRPTGCPFHPRCHFAEDRCKTEQPPLLPVQKGHCSACHFANDLDEAGVETRSH